MEEWAKINDTIVILNAFYFKSDEENYMKITGYFDYTYIVYVFFDYLNSMSYSRTIFCNFNCGNACYFYREKM